MAHGGGGGVGTLIRVGVFIGVIGLLNLLSYIFNWGYFFY